MRSSASSNNSSNNNNHNTTTKPLCRFYVLHNGICRYGSKCAYSHELPEGTSFEDAKQCVPCPYFMARGGCRYGDHCQLMHHEGNGHSNSNLTTTGRTPTTTIYNKMDDDANCKQRATNNNSNVVTTAKDTHSEQVGNKDEDEQEEEHGETEEGFTTCGICLDDCPHRQFGLLSCCNHAFCYDCLMEWRKEGASEVRDRRSCPTCRKHSDYVIPSPVFPTNEVTKAAIVQDYKDRKAHIPCRRFEKTGKFGSCPFGSDCFYAHVDRTGRDVKSQDKSMTTIRAERELRRQRQQEQHRRHRWGDDSSEDDHPEFLLDFLRFLDLHGYPHVRDQFMSSDDDDDEDEDDYDDDDYEGQREDDDEDDDDPYGDAHSMNSSDFARHVRAYLPIVADLEQWADTEQQPQQQQYDWWES